MTTAFSLRKAMFAMLLQITVLAVFAQSNISGVVQSSSGDPIEFALVSHSDNFNVWTKSDENGQFSIEGDLNTALTVAALRYQTIHEHTPSNLNEEVIVMETDVLLDTDVLHISFDHLRPGDQYSREELHDDFNVAYGGGFYQNDDPETDRASVDATRSVVPGGRSLRVTYPEGGLVTRGSGVDTRIPLANTFRDNDFKADELYLSYWVKFSDNYQFDKCGGKLPSLGGCDWNTRGDNRWKGR